MLYEGGWLFRCLWLEVREVNTSIMVGSDDWFSGTMLWMVNLSYFTYNFVKYLSFERFFNCLNVWIIVFCEFDGLTDCNIYFQIPNFFLRIYGNDNLFNCMEALQSCLTIVIFYMNVERNLYDSYYKSMECWIWFNYILKCSFYILIVYINEFISELLNE